MAKMVMANKSLTSIFYINVNVEKSEFGTDFTLYSIMFYCFQLLYVDCFFKHSTQEYIEIHENQECEEVNEGGKVSCIVWCCLAFLRSHLEDFWHGYICMTKAFGFYFQGNILMDCSYNLMVARQGEEPSMTCV